jgi:YHS domain-containing protein
MSDVSELVARIDGEFAKVKERIKVEQQQFVKEHQDRKKRLVEYTAVQEKLVAAVKPRLQALAARAGDRVAVKPTVCESRRTAKFEFKSPKAYITLSFSMAPDRDIKNVVVDYDLKVVPVLWQFESHMEFSTPIASPDLAGLCKWVDDRIVGFVELFIRIHEGEFFDSADYAEDPVAKVKFPKFAASATLEHAGQTYFFIDEENKAEFARQRQMAVGKP